MIIFISHFLFILLFAVEAIVENVKFKIELSSLCSESLDPFFKCWTNRELHIELPMQCCKKIINCKFFTSPRPLIIIMENIVIYKNICHIFDLLMMFDDHMKTAEGF